MAIISVKEIWDGRTSKLELEKTSREYTRVFRVLTDSTADGPLTVRLAYGIPQLYNFYVDPNGTFDTGALASEITATQDSDYPYSWKVSVHYATHPAQIKDPQKNKDNPTDRAADISWDFAYYQKAIQKDLDGKDIVNSAGDTFDPQPTFDDVRPTLTISQDEGGFSPALAYAMVNHVNADAFMGAGPGQVKCFNIGAKSKYEKGMYTWKVTYQFHFRTEGFQPSYLDIGYHKLVGGKRQAIMTKGPPPQNVSVPVKLDGNGGELTIGQPGVYLKFRVYDNASFSALPIRLSGS